MTVSACGQTLTYSPCLIRHRVLAKRNSKKFEVSKSGERSHINELKRISGPNNDFLRDYNQRSSNDWQQTQRADLAYETDPDLATPHRDIMTTKVERPYAAYPDIGTSNRNIKTKKIQHTRHLFTFEDNSQDRQNKAYSPTQWPVEKDPQDFQNTKILNPSRSPRPILNQPLEIQTPLDFQRPFSRSFCALFGERHCPLDWKFYGKLQNLFRFFGEAFFFENLNPLALTHLSNLERTILLKICEHKEYNLQKQILEAIKKPDPEARQIKLFHTVYRPKRKEENVKYAFRVLIKFFVQRFDHQHLTKFNTTGKFSRKHKETLFYLYYFSQQALNMNFEECLQRFTKSQPFRKSCSNRIKKYSFPDMNRRAIKGRAKTLSSEFFRRVSISKPFKKLLNSTLLYTLAYIGDLDALAPNQDTLRSEIFNEPGKELNVIRLALGNNFRESTKMFSEWNNLYQKELKRKRTSNPELHKLTSLEIYQLIIINIRKPNFKFPWSLCEIKNAFLDAFFWINEHIHPERRISSTLGMDILYVRVLQQHTWEKHNFGFYFVNIYLEVSKLWQFRVCFSV